jgi:DNA-directed RNA polymerase specialized sigma24 family protein
VSAENGTEQWELLDPHRVLETLEREEPALAQVVEMHYGGMTAEEASVALERSVHVVRHQLRIGRAWLRRELAR